MQGRKEERNREERQYKKRAWTKKASTKKRVKKQSSVRVRSMDPAHWRGKGNQLRPRFRTGH
jgi:hypothetical protein